jgi:ABC-type polysaccharide/polyol phosphate export permease
MDRALTANPAWKEAFDRYRFALAAFVRRDLKGRYSGTTLGLGWTVLQPILLLALYTFVFSVIMKVRFRGDAETGNFAVYLTSGMFPFLALSEGIHRAATSLTANRNLLDKVRFPAEVLPAVGVVSSTINEIVGLSILILAGGLFDVPYSAWLAFLPVLILLRVVLTVGIALLVSVLSVFMADIGQFVGLFLTTWMFLTPIFYPAELVPESFEWALRVNPLYHLVEGYRAVILEARSPLDSLPVLVVSAGSSFGLGLAFFRGTVERAKDFL